MNCSHRQPGNRRQKCVGQLGFTLVELLVVIVIIAILAGLLVPAVGNAINSAKNARMGIEISNLAKAMERYRMKYQEFPPDFSSLTPLEDTAALKNHLSRNFRFRNPLKDSANLKTGLFSGLDPAEALVFWLRGFNDAPERPVMGAIVGAGELFERERLSDGREKFFDFDEARLRDDDGDGFLEYYPQDSPGQPYVYFNHQTYAQAYAGFNRVGELSEKEGAGQRIYVRPYVRAAITDASARDFVAPEKYQIICAGQDQEFGKGGSVYPNGPYTKAEQDNIASFSEGETLEDQVP